MRKSELIEALSKIEGDPEVFVSYHDSSAYNGDGCDVQNPVGEPVYHKQFPLDTGWAIEYKDLILLHGE